MSLHRFFSKKEMGKDARKRSAYDIDGALNDAAGATRDVKRRQQPKLPSLQPPSTAPSPRGVLGAAASRLQGPPGGSGTGALGGPQVASGGARGIYSAPSKRQRKHVRLTGSTSSKRDLPKASTVPSHVDRLSFAAHKLSKTASPPVKHAFNPADQTAGVLDDESNNSDESKSSDGSDDDSEATRGGRHPIDTTGLKEEERIESSGSPYESSEDSESEVYDSSEDEKDEKDDKDGDDDTSMRGLSAEDDGSDTGSSFEEISETPSGKPYNMFKNEDGTLEKVKGALIPDGYRLQYLASFPEYRFICPVRDCRKLFIERPSLVGHFCAAHSRCHFIDNLDKDATLTVQRKVAKGLSVVVSQRPLDDSAPALKSPSLPSKYGPTSRRRSAEVGDINDAEYDPTSIIEPTHKAPSIRQPSERGTLTKPNAARSSGGTAPELFAVEDADIKSEAWTDIKPFVNIRWLALFQTEHERSAFLQAITLPKRNEVDKAWVEGTYKSHQKVFRSLLSLVFHIVGVRATCSGCERRSMERRRNCMILPPEAKDMRELQEVIGSQCVNCFFFPGNHPCEFATSSPTVDVSTGVKQTYNPARNSLPARVAKSSSRLESHIAKGLSMPTPSQSISHSPIPVPVLPLRLQLSQVHGPAERSNRGPVRRSEVRIDDHGDSVPDNDDLTSGTVYTDDVKLNEEPVSAGATTFASGSASGAPLSSSALVSKAFTLFGEITQLPDHEQAKVYDKIAAMLGVASGAPTTTRTAASGKTQGSISHQYHGPAADGWEIAPGRLISGGEPVAFSTSSLRRKAVTSSSAQYVTPAEKVLNKHITALDHLKIKPEIDWDCKFSVTKGMVKVKMGDVEASIGYGGILLVKYECIVTNAWHDESHIQVWWKQVDE